MLKTIMDQLVSVITDYYTAQTNKSVPLEDFNQKTALQLQEMLIPLIEESTSRRNSRKNFLEYIAHIVVTWKALIEQDILLEQDEYSKLEKTLIQFFSCSRQLLILSHHTTLPLEYESRTISIFGFNNGLLNNSLSMLGDILKTNLFDKFKLSTVVNPSLDEINQFLTTVMSAYQLKPTQTQIEALKIENRSLKEENEKLLSKTKTLQLKLKAVKNESQVEPSFGELASVLASKFGLFTDVGEGFIKPHHAPQSNPSNENDSDDDSDASVHTTIIKEAY